LCIEWFVRVWVVRVVFDSRDARKCEVLCGNEVAG
jgi:hypothetical protein